LVIGDVRLGRICNYERSIQEWGILKGERIWRSDSVAIFPLSVRFQSGEETTLGPCVSTFVALSQSANPRITHPLGVIRGIFLRGSPRGQNRRL